MSRISEALARAKDFRPEELPSVPAGVSGGAPEFPLEAVEEPVASVPDVAAASPQKSRTVAADTPAEPRLSDLLGRPEVDAEADITRLPIAEKLMLNAGHTMPAEQYRHLAARMLMAQAEKGTRLVMVTSAFPGEGKTLTATNLALTLSESYKRKVLLIDGDLRRPTVHQIFQIPNVSGLNDGLRDDGDRRIPLLSFTENLSILTAGRPEPDPMSVLSGDRVRRVLEEAASRFDWIIIDTPPVALLTDAHLLSSLVDAVVLVVQSGRTPLPAVNTAIQAVGRDRILGVVLNRADSGLPNAAYASYGAYHHAEKA